MRSRLLSCIFALYISFESLCAHEVSCPVYGTGKERISYLNIATEMIMKVKELYLDNTTDMCPELEEKPADCEEVLRNGGNASGVYEVWPKSRVLNGKAVEVYCDMETDGGGWTVIQRRGNFSREKDYFFQSWNAYKDGFGAIEEDFWLGNDNIFALSSQKLNSIRFDLEDVEGNKRYALYDKFWIDDEENKYMLHINGYSGNAGDSMSKIHDEQKFSTKDQDNDKDKKQSCAKTFKGGWWYNACHDANLNGIYFGGKHESFADGVNWLSWKGYHESLGTTEMKIRCKDFKREVTVTEVNSNVPDYEL